MTCNRCGTECERQSNRQKWCPGCKAEIDRERDRARREKPERLAYEKRRKSAPESKEKDRQLKRQLRQDPEYRAKVNAKARTPESRAKEKARRDRSKQDPAWRERQRVRDRERRRRETTERRALVEAVAPRTVRKISVHALERSRERYAANRETICSQNRTPEARAKKNEWRRKRRAELADLRAKAAALAAVESYVLSLFPTDSTTQE